MHSTPRLWLVHWRALLAFAMLLFTVSAQPVRAQRPVDADPPSRVGVVTLASGSVVFAPTGETDWSELPRNRPMAGGDRIWTDENARAELHFGAAVLHMDSRTFVEIIAVDDDVVQVAVNEGSVNARLRGLRAGDSFEIVTPHLVLRASPHGEWRIDVDPQRGISRVMGRAGRAVAYGTDRGAQPVAAGQLFTFSGRELTAAAAHAPLPDSLDRWAAERLRAEDQSISARMLPREVVGYSLLDAHGSWSHDASLGPVWFPRVAADWAPYRHGRWDWIAPWGWTWIDDAPWGFAPFHYGRWSVVASRWAWVPGPLGRHPAYAPALVAFASGTPGIAWYPLAPGEIWYPFVETSLSYVRRVNRHLVADSRAYNTGSHAFLRADTITAVRSDDFHRGRPLQGRWLRPGSWDVSRARTIAAPAPAKQSQAASGETWLRGVRSY